MALKISKGVWMVSVLGLLAALLYVYASLPESVLISQEGSTAIYLGREGFFYAGLAVITLVNTLVFIVSRFFSNDAALQTWFNGLIIALNIFFVVSFFLVSAVNSLEKFNFERIGFMIYGSLALIAAWTISWPIYRIIRKFSPKAAV